MAQGEEKAKKEVKENKVNKHFFKDFKAELKKVIWPTPKQLVNSTVAVVVIVLIVSVIVFGLDAIFKTVNKYGITNLQSAVKDKFADEIENPEVDAESQENVNEGELVENGESNEVENGGEEIEIQENQGTENNSEDAE